jgi:hypothetical protein
VKTALFMFLSVLKLKLVVSSKQMWWAPFQHHETEGAGGAERLKQGERSDWSRGSEGTRAGGADRLEQEERSG